MSRVVVQFFEGDAPWLTAAVASRLNRRLRDELAQLTEPFTEDQVSDAVCVVMRDAALPEIAQHLRRRV